MEHSTPSIESLPTEILENVCLFLAPPLNRRVYVPLRSPNWTYAPRKPYRDDCKSMRLTCKTFSKLRTPSASLFYDFNIFASRRSLDNLELLSQHQVLRNYVHRLVFCRPELTAWLSKDSIYEYWVQSRGHEYTHDQVKAGLRAYKAAFQEQERILGDGTYIESCGRYISHFPNLSSIFITNMVPRPVNLDCLPKKNCRTLLQRQHPDVLLEKIYDIGVPIDSADRHLAIVFRTLAVADVLIEELVTYDYWGSTPKFSCGSIPQWPNMLDLSKLSRLDLCSRDEDMVDKGMMNLSSVICPVLEKTPALVELYPRFFAIDNQYPAIDGLWELNFPKLNVLAVQGLKLSQMGFANFIGRHIHLWELTLHEVIENDDRWFNIFKSLHEHPEIDDLEMTYSHRGLLACRISTFDPPEPEPSGNLTLKLYDYLHGKGEWTAGLSSVWGDA